MRSAVVASLAAGALAARPFLTEPDTGIDDVLGATEQGTLPDLDDMWSLPDFEWAARRFLPTSNYTSYANGASGEFSLRNNVEIFHRYSWKPRQMVDVTGLPGSMNTTILGHNFSAPFFICPAALAGSAHPGGEINIVEGAAAGDILYVASSYSTYTIEEIHAAKKQGQVVFQQVYLDSNYTSDVELIRRVEDAGADALVITVDSTAGSIRQRAFRYDVGSANTEFQRLTWDYYEQLRNVTTIPIVLKGVTSVQTARESVEHGVDAIVLSNHGGRNLDGSPSPVEILMEIHREAPEILDQIEIWADSGVRYGGDVLKLLALGATAVGLARPYMFANIYGTEGIEAVTEMLRNEVMVEAGNLGLGKLHDIDTSYLSMIPNLMLG